MRDEGERKPGHPFMMSRRENLIKNLVDNEDNWQLLDQISVLIDEAERRASAKRHGKKYKAYYNAYRYGRASEELMTEVENARIFLEDWLHYERKEQKATGWADRHEAKRN